MLAATASAAGVIHVDVMIFTVDRFFYEGLGYLKNIQKGFDVVIRVHTLTPPIITASSSSSKVGGSET